MIKSEVRPLGSRHQDGKLMYPGLWRFTWIWIGGAWLLLAIEPHDDPAA